jgi:hypothetical protein
MVDIAISMQQFLDFNMAGNRPKTARPLYCSHWTYIMFGTFQAKVKATAHLNKYSLRQTIQQEWYHVSEAMVRATCHAFSVILVPRKHLYITFKTIFHV